MTLIKFGLISGPMAQANECVVELYTNVFTGSVGALFVPGALVARSALALIGLGEGITEIPAMPEVSVSSGDYWITISCSSGIPICDASSQMNTMTEVAVTPFSSSPPDVFPPISNAYLDVAYALYVVGY
jgi:hypothetical protein